LLCFIFLLLHIQSFEKCDDCDDIAIFRFAQNRCLLRSYFSISSGLLEMFRAP
jgi:hypothetical protein